MIGTSGVAEGAGVGVEVGVASGVGEAELIGKGETAGEGDGVIVGVGAVEGLGETTGVGEVGCTEGDGEGLECAMKFSRPLDGVDSANCPLLFLDQLSVAELELYLS